MEKNQKSPPPHDQPDTAVLVFFGNLVWMGLLSLDRLALASIGKARDRGSAQFLYQLPAGQTPGMESRSEMGGYGYFNFHTFGIWDVDLGELEEGQVNG